MSPSSYLHIRQGYRVTYNPSYGKWLGGAPKPLSMCSWETGPAAKQPWDHSANANVPALLPPCSAKPQCYQDWTVGWGWENQGNSVDSHFLLNQILGVVSWSYRGHPGWSQKQKHCSNISNSSCAWFASSRFRPLWWQLITKKMRPERAKGTCACCQPIHNSWPLEMYTSTMVQKHLSL